MGVLQRRLIGLGATSGFLLGGVIASQACSPSAKQLPPDDFTLPTYDAAPYTYTPADGGPQPVRAVVYGSGGPEANITVAFQNASGALISSQPTDALGRAASSDPNVSQVTFLLGTSNAPALLTYVGVEPGDLLVALDTPNNVSYVGSLDSVPPLTPALVEAGAQYYSAYSGRCTSTFYPMFPIPIDLNAPLCVNLLGQFPLLVTVQDGNGAYLGYTFSRGGVVGLADGGVNVSVDNSAPWNTTFANWTINTSNLPLTNVSVAAAFSEVQNGIASWNTNYVEGIGDGGAMAPSNFTMHPGFSDFVQSEVNVTTNVQSGFNYAAIATRADAPTKDGNVTFDVSQVPAAVTFGAIDYVKTPGQPTLSWTYAGTSNAQGVVAVLAWSNYFPDSGGYSSNTWTFVLPPTAVSLQAPVLPSGWSQWSPENFNYDNGPAVTAFNGDGLTSYKDFRAYASALPVPNYQNLFGQQPLIPPLPFNGTMTLTSFGPNND